MKTSIRLLFVLIILSAVTAACSTGGSQSEPAATDVAPAATESAPAATEAPATEAAVPTEAPAEPTQPKIETEFPMPEDAFDAMDLNGTISFKTGMKQADLIAFYRDEFTKAGYKEREITTTITDTIFSLVFDGHANGKGIVVQAVDLGDGSTNVTLRFE